MQRSSVLLPEPLAPMMEITSPVRAARVDALQHLQLAEPLVQPADGDGDVLAHHACARRKCGFSQRSSAAIARVSRKFSTR